MCIVKNVYLYSEGRCVENSLRCDGSQDCSDGQDEVEIFILFENFFYFDLSVI